MTKIKKNNSEKFMGVSLKWGLSAIVLADKIDASEGVYEFKDNLKYRFDEYFYSAQFFNTFVLSRLKECKGQTNEAYARSLFRVLMEKLCMRILSRNESIDLSLDKYLKKEDIDFSYKFLKENIKESKDKYSIFLFTDLLELRNISSIKIGNVSIFKIENDFIKKLPSEFMQGNNSPTLGALLKPPTLPKDLKKYIVFEIEIEGYHYGNEKSLVFEKALFEFRNIFAYLNTCDVFLSNLAKDKYNIEKKDISTNSFFMHSNKSGFQRYFICPQREFSFLKQIELYFEEILFSKQKIIISQQTFEQIQARCYLNEFNAICKDKGNTEVAKKIIRSFDWFFKANLEEDSTDTVIDYFISLETLFSTGQTGANNKIIAENIALTNSWELKRRMDDYKKYSKLLKWRNKIVHNGSRFEENDNCWGDLRTLKIGLVWSLIDLVKNYPKIISYATDSSAINNFYQRQKMSPKLLLNDK